MKDEELFELCKEVYKRFPEWDNKSSTQYSERLKVWRRGFSISEMGEGNDAYETTPPEERNKVNVYDWEIKDDARHQLTTGQEVFKWWYSEVRNLENDIVPLYTSDYLLEKLPEEIHNETFGYYWRLTMKKGLGGYIVDYENRMWVRDNKSTLTRRGINSDDMTSWKEPIYGDTPLKALLKLVIALDDAGVKL